MPLAEGRRAGASRRVTGFSVEVSAAGRPFYADEVQVTLSSLDVPATPGEAAATPGRAIPVPASGMVSLPLGGPTTPDGRRHVVLDYDVDGGASRTCFDVRPADGTWAVLWSGCLDPGEERGRVALDVPDEVEELALAARCADDACPAHCTVEPGVEAAR